MWTPGEPIAKLEGKAQYPLFAREGGCSSAPHRCRGFGLKRAFRLTPCFQSSPGLRSELTSPSTGALHLDSGTSSDSVRSALPYSSDTQGLSQTTGHLVRLGLWRLQHELCWIANCSVGSV